jgi:hypothetical protein
LIVPRAESGTHEVVGDGVTVLFAHEGSARNPDGHALGVPAVPTGGPGDGVALPADTTTQGVPAPAGVADAVADVAEPPDEQPPSRSSTAASQ